MATHITSGTTTGGAVTTVTFANWYRGIQVLNRSVGDMWVRADGTNPTIAGDECFYIAPNGFLQLSNPKLPPEPALGTASNTEVRILTAANANYTVEAGV